MICAGDLVNVDVSAELGGYFADNGGTRAVLPTTALQTRLCHATRGALKAVMKQARAGAPINAIGGAIERTARAYRFKVIENLASHGVGRALHEEPTEILGYRDTRVLHEGQVITIHPQSHRRRSGRWLDAGGCPQQPLGASTSTRRSSRGAPIVVTTH